MNWFRNAKYDKSKKQVKPVVTPSKPKMPAKAPFKKPKKVYKGPKDPHGYKRKLFIPRKFIVAGLDVKATYEIDQSEYALQELDRQASEAGLDIAIMWRTEMGVNCPTCLDLADRRWHSVQDFLSSRQHTSPGSGIYGHSHPGCRCHLKVIVGDDESRYTVIIPDSQAHLDIGWPPIEEIVDRHLGEEGKPPSEQPPQYGEKWL